MASRKKLSSVNETELSREWQSASDGTRESDELSNLISRVESTESRKSTASHATEPKGYRGLADSSHTNNTNPTSKALSIAVAFGAVALLAFAVYHVTVKVQAVVGAASHAASSAVGRGSLLQGGGSTNVSSSGLGSMLPKATLPRVSGFRSNIQPEPSTEIGSKGRSHVHALKSHWYQMPTQ